MIEEFVTVATFSQPVEAHLARTKLESEGIRCFVSDEHLIQVNWLLSNAIGGVKLKVPASEAARARDVLRPRPRLVVVADPGDEGNPDDLICPRCRSYDVYYHRFSRGVALATAALFSFFIPWLKRRWVCKQCGYEWADKLENPSRRDRS